MDLTSLLDNAALAFVGLHSLDDRNGKPCLLAIAKLTWRVNAEGTVRLADPQREIRLAAQHRDTGSVRYPNNALAEKPGTDVIVLGHAHPPQGKAVKEMLVSVSIRDKEVLLEQSLRVFGPRVFMAGASGLKPGPAIAFTEPVPLVYELAKGGSDPQQPDVLDAKNPVGIGTRADMRSLVDSPAYRIESVDGNEPAGFGAIDQHWSPRLERYGTIDDTYLRTRYPLPPKDFDALYWNCAHPKLHSSQPLRGDEEIELKGMRPAGDLCFRLPFYTPRFDATVDDEERPLPTHLDTLLVDFEDPDELVVEAVWRAAVSWPRKRERLEKISVTNGSAIGTDIEQALAH